MVLRDGFDPARIFVKGYGESQPIADNTSDEGRTRNRRVEFLILVPEGYENVMLEAPENRTEAETYSKNRDLLQRGPDIDPLAIEQAIIEKTGAETARPVGAFSQVDKVEKK